MPPDLDSGLRATCSPALGPGWLRRENAGRGLRVAIPPDAPTGQLYLDTVSAVCGQAVRVSVSAPPGRYRLRAVRIGWYRGLGGRLVAVSPLFAARRQRDALGTTEAGSPGWRTTRTLTVGRTWPPGFYVVQLTTGARVLSAAPLVVMAPRGAPRASELFVVASMTWTAYTTFGGRSLYRNIALRGAAATDDRARVVSFARPMQGPGFIKVFRESAPLVRAVEHAGVDVDYAPDTDVDRTPSLLVGRAGVLTGSHTEYVTRRIFDAFEAARDAGTNLAFLGGNQFYWQARLGRDASGRALAMTVYRYADEDPLAVTEPALATVRWRDAPVRRPEAQLLGAMYRDLGVVVPLVVLDAPAWLGWTPGQIVPKGAASEVDAAVPGVTPQGTQILASGAAMDRGHEVDVAVTYYVARSGAGVFDAADVLLGCTTDADCDSVRMPPPTRAFWSRTVIRVVQAFSVPRFGASHPSVPSTAVPSYRQLLQRYGVAGVGTTAASTD